MSNISWYLGRNGPYGTTGTPALRRDIPIDTPPQPRRDYRYDIDAMVWVAKTQGEVDGELDAQVTNELNSNKLLKAVIRYIAQLHGISPAEARNQIKTIYRSL